MKEMIDRLESRYAWSSLEVDGHTWRWIDTAANGPAVVLLPGSVGDGAMFVRTLLSLGERLRMIAVTYPALADPHRLASGLKAVMDHLGLPASVVVGSSFAAWWAQYFALDHPDMVRKLVIGNGFTDAADLADNPLFDAKWVAGVTDEALHATWLGRVESSPVTPLQQLQKLMLSSRQSPRNLRSRFVGVTQARACPPLPIAPQQVVVLDCADDPLIPPAARDRLRDAYPKARHVRLATGGHYPHLLNAEAYESLLLDLAFE